MAPLTITPSNSLKEFLHFVSAIFSSDDLEEFVPRGLISEDSNCFIKLEDETSTWILRFLILLNQQTQGISWLSGVNDSDFQEKIGLLLPRGSKDGYVSNPGDS